MDIESAKESSHHRATPLTNTHYTIALLRPSLRKIHKVPPLLRQEERNSDAYDPKVVSFGPYHHGKPELQFCQEAKRFALQMFAEGSTQSPEFFFTKVLEVIPDARKLYIDSSTDDYTDEEFAEMMLLDACFLVYYMGIGNQNKQHQFLMYKHLGSLVLSLVNRDIFLLENQIPFQILMLLINLRHDNEGGNKNEGKTDKNKGEEAVSKFSHQSIWGQYTEQQVQDSQQHQHQPLHLFEAFRRVLVWDNIPQSQVNKDQKQNVDLKKHHKTFRTAKDLKAKGIHFQPSCNKSLKDINFCSFTFYGQLQLPTWFVSSLSKVFFMNMIAYELCPNNLVDSTVISYLNFMKSIVESPDDVKELREKRILLTHLGSDEEVVRLYRDLNTYGVANTRSYQDVKERIQEHYDSKAKTWMAELIHNYFSSPWSIIAWLAGVLLPRLEFSADLFHNQSSVESVWILKCNLYWCRI